MSLWSRLQLKRKFLLVVAGSLIISIALSTWVSSTLVRDHAVERISNEEIPAVLGSVAGQIALQLETRLAVTRTMANNSFLSRWIADGEQDVDALQQYLRQIQQRERALTAFLVSGDSKNYFTVNGLSRQISASDDWFYSFMRGSDDYSLDLDLDQTTGVPTLFINFRVPNTQVLTGLGLEVRALSQLIDGYRIGEAGRVFLVDANGDMKIRPQSASDLPDDLQRYGLSGQQQSQLLQPSGGAVIEIDEKLMAARHIPSLDWYLVAEIPTQQVFADLNATTAMVVVMNLALIVVFTLLAMWLAASLARPIIRTANMLSSIADGDADLTSRLEVASQDEVGELAQAFNRFMGNMQELMRQLAKTADAVEEASAWVSDSARKSQRNCHDQVDSIAMVATAITEMGATVKEIADNANSTADSSSDSASKAEAGQALVTQTSDEIGVLDQEINDASSAIRSLAKEVDNIGSVLSVISGISEQTNLLALNAAIEAARAGEQGRGFAVVADEVRTLAQKTHQSTQEINQMIARLQDGTQQAVSAMEAGSEQCRQVVDHANEARQALDGVRSAIVAISDRTFQVATATEEQASVVADLNQHIEHINTLAEQTLQTSSETAQSCDERLHSAATDLTDIVRNFRY
ncbi:hypothetical protein CHH28_15785 [Bacterioplanes sanyensis]|uniref:Methyl-accepting chemotaxis protein n=1 Tax=Bacterioplanes sanyensis TaxID=1249553 RepID=A0A222FP90_9GAMM|nr:methyl-accepting chemotaxis protein [Bacterioplanes sanyensis]ASP40043.1 hypothetical protein CHH28_15785 [Bacterioplanes sanyensis]